MRVSEKTIELTICSQISARFRHFRFPFQQPLWFGLTQVQEAKAGFDAATRLGNKRILLLQYKAGYRLKRGAIKFSAQHSQLTALQSRVNTQKRLILYVLPSVTQTHELSAPSRWVLDTTWFLDVADIPALVAPSRKSQNHLMYLDPSSGIVKIRSEPVEAQAISASFLLENISSPYIGATYDSFDKFWTYAKFLRRNAVAATLPE